jgi:hypothetical protein
MKQQPVGLIGIAVAAIACGLPGCTRDTVRIAWETQRRADQVQQAVFDQQHESLRILLFRDLVRQLAAAGGPLSDQQRQVLSDAWNERDLVEFWALQQERARALRLVGVDSKLGSDQSVLDLLIKSVERRADAVTDALAAQRGQTVTQPVERTHSAEE